MTARRRRFGSVVLLLAQLVLATRAPVALGAPVLMPERPQVVEAGGSGAAAEALEEAHRAPDGPTHQHEPSTQFVSAPAAHGATAQPTDDHSADHHGAHPDHGGGPVHDHSGSAGCHAGIPCCTPTLGTATLRNTPAAIVSVSACAPPASAVGAEHIAGRRTFRQPPAHAPPTLG
jgi:hypothetical protein